MVSRYVFFLIPFLLLAHGSQTSNSILILSDVPVVRDGWLNDLTQHFSSLLKPSIGSARIYVTASKKTSSSYYIHFATHVKLFATIDALVNSKLSELLRVSKELPIGAANTNLSLSTMKDVCQYTGTLRRISLTSALTSRKCTRSFSFTLATAEAIPSENVASVLCFALSGRFSCDDLEVVSTGSTHQVFVRHVDPVVVLNTVRSGLDTLSPLTTLQVSRLSVDGFEIYSNYRSVTTSEKKGDFGYCVMRAWYLSLILLVIPVTYFFSLYFYRCGYQRGKESVNALYQEGMLRLNQAENQDHIFMELAIQQQQQMAANKAAMGYNRENSSNNNLTNYAMLPRPFPASQQGWPSFEQMQYKNFYSQQNANPSAHGAGSPNN